ncbi:hypothetical protein MRX96_046993, partial [Rhipicephalus microplus]
MLTAKFLKSFCREDTFQNRNTASKRCAFRKKQHGMVRFFSCGAFFAILACTLGEELPTAKVLVQIQLGMVMCA